MYLKKFKKSLAVVLAATTVFGMSSIPALAEEGEVELAAVEEHVHEFSAENATIEWNDWSGVTVTPKYATFTCTVNGCKQKAIVNPDDKKADGTYKATAYQVPVTNLGIYDEETKPDLLEEYPSMASYPVSTDADCENDGLVVYVATATLPFSKQSSDGIVDDEDKTPITATGYTTKTTKKQKHAFEAKPSADYMVDNYIEGDSYTEQWFDADGNILYEAEWDDNVKGRYTLTAVCKNYIARQNAMDLLVTDVDTVPANEKKVLKGQSKDPVENCEQRFGYWSTTFEVGDTAGTVLTFTSVEDEVQPFPPYGIAIPYAGNGEHKVSGEGTWVYDVVDGELKKATCSQNGQGHQEWECEVCHNTVVYNAAHEKYEVKNVDHQNWQIVTTPKLPHTEVEYNVVSTATCTTAGVETYDIKCSVCGEVLSTGYTRPAAAKGHKKVLASAAKEPTCTKDGQKAYWQCEVCGEYFLDGDFSTEAGAATLAGLDYTIAALGHDYVYPTGSAATCRSNVGYDVTCSRCDGKWHVTGHTYLQTNIGNEANRAIDDIQDDSFKVTAYVAPTCYKDANGNPAVKAGYVTTAWVCKVCGDTRSNQGGSDAIVDTRCVEHNWVVSSVRFGDTIATGRTYTATYVCDNCGQTMDRRFDVGDDYEYGKDGKYVDRNHQIHYDKTVYPRNQRDLEAKLVSKDTTTNIQWAVTILGKEYKSKNFQGHDHVAGEVVIDEVVLPTATENGHHVEIVTCTICGEELSRKYVEDPMGSVTPVPVPATYSFKDVVEGRDWFYDDVMYVAEAGIMTGYEGNTYFGPNDNLSRADFVTILYRIAGEPDVNTSSKFADVPEEAYYAKAVNWAASHNYVTGYGGTNLFGSADPITREQMATILYRYNGSTPAKADLSKYPDANKISDWARPAVEWAVSEGIMGVAKELNPLGNTLRCETAAMIHRMMDK
jgi:hypothetical protein